MLGTGGQEMENLNAEQVISELMKNDSCYAEDIKAIQNAIALIISQEQRIEELEAECKQWRSDWEKYQKRWEIAYDELDKEKHDIELTLVGVMFSVDKWLDGAELELDEVNRAITMREKTLRIVEKLTEENERLKSEVSVKRKLLDKAEVRIDCLEEVNKVLQADICNATMNLEHITKENDRVKADTVRKYREQLHRAFAHSDSKDKFNKGVFLGMVDLIAKEMVEGKDEIRD